MQSVDSLTFVAIFAHRLLCCASSHRAINIHGSTLDGNNAHSQTSNNSIIPLSWINFQKCLFFLFKFQSVCLGWWGSGVGGWSKIVPLPLKSRSFVTAFLLRPPFLSNTKHTHTHITALDSVQTETAVQNKKKCTQIRFLLLLLIKVNFWFCFTATWETTTTTKKIHRHVMRTSQMKPSVQPGKFLQDQSGKVCGDSAQRKKGYQMRSRSAVRLCYAWPSWRTIPPYLRFAFRRIGYRERGRDREREKRCRSSQIGGLIRAVQSPVCLKPFVVMCHTPARQTASWSGQQQTQLAEPRPRSLCSSSPLSSDPFLHTHTTWQSRNKTDLSGENA